MTPCLTALAGHAGVGRPPAPDVVSVLLVELFAPRPSREYRFAFQVLVTVLSHSAIWPMTGRAGTCALPRSGLFSSGSVSPGLAKLIGSAGSSTHFATVRNC